ncbi:MAG: D-alanyl-D-alanine carboxypeptidase [Spirosomataceae bacterium]
MKYISLSIGLLMALVNFSCKTVKTPTVSPKPIWETEVEKLAVFAQNHTGFALYDATAQQMMVSYQADRYFVPASNTKLFSFYAGLSCLGDSIPALKYTIRGDSLLFWGTGDPSLLHPDLHNTKVFDFLRSRSEKLFYSTSNDQVNPYGAGWQWDDYNDYYQPEVTGLPMYGNIIRFKARFTDRLEVNPPYFWQFLQPDTARKATQRVVRDFYENRFVYQPFTAKVNYEQDVPFRTSAALTTALLSDTLHRQVTLVNLSPQPNWQVQTLYSLRADTLYKRMLQVSDNMLAEQLMILCASASNKPLSSENGIGHVMRTYLSDLPDKPTWVDGSGLSRYNVFTPRTMVALLQKIQAKVPQERLFELLAIGGKTGTLRNQFKEAEPFVFAKTGSVSNVYNLSGYLKTKSGKLLIFSMMNNNFVRPTSEIRKEVERILRLVYEGY